MDSKIEPVAWECYYPGAGSVDSQTFVVRTERQRAKHEADGAQITNLYAAPPEAALLAAEQRGRESERERAAQNATKAINDAVRAVPAGSFMDERLPDAKTLVRSVAAAIRKGD